MLRRNPSSKSLTKASLAFMVVIASGCGKDDGKPKEQPFAVVVKDADADSGLAGAGGEGTAGFSIENKQSLAAFKTTLAPVLREHCAACHGATTSPFFAVTDDYQAHKVVIESHLVAPSAAPSSRFVTRLALNNHNCWSECASDATIMGDAIEAWIKAGNIDDSGAKVINIGAVALADARELVLPGSGGNWVREAENFDAMGAAFEVVVEPTASNKASLARVPAPGGNDGNGNPLPAPQGEVVFEFPIPAGGPYSLWFRVKSLGVGNSLSYRVNGGQQRSTNATANTQDWIWTQAFAGEALTPLRGSGMVTIAITTSQLGIDMVAVTANPTFDRAVTENTGRRAALEFDLRELLGVRAKLFLLLSPGLDDKSVLLSRPTLQIEEPGVSINYAGIHVMVNDTFNPQYSTFAALSGSVVGGSTELSPQSMVVGAAAGNDLISVGLKTLELVRP